jgi:GDPmannose 4,6-dehydratase
LAQLLVSNNYQVFGSSRDAQSNCFSNFKKLCISEMVQTETIDPIDFRGVLQAIIRLQPDEIYNLSGQSSVGLSFREPVATFDSISKSTLNFLEAIRISGLKTKFFGAASGESFGSTDSHAANESSHFHPQSPYAVAKATAFWNIAMYREAYGLFACSGILFNHESPLRPERFVTKKIVAAAVRIANGSDETLEVGNLNIRRDWGWAPEYVDAMWRILQQPNAEDYVIATGSTFSLEEFLDCAFVLCGLDWREHVRIDQTLARPLDIAESRADPRKAKEKLGWVAQHHMKSVAKMMIAAEAPPTNRRDDQR